MRQILFALAMLLSTSVYAAPVTWTIDETYIAYNEPWLVFGTFDYDADLNIYSNVSIVSQGVNWGGNYQQVLTSRPDELALLLPNEVDSLRTSLSINFDSSLSNAGGTVQIRTIIETNGYIEKENIAVYSGVVTAVPIPAAVWLFGSALAGLGWLKRKQSA